MMVCADPHSCDKPMNVAGTVLPGVFPMVTLAKLEEVKPVPLRLTADAAPVDELLAMIN